MSDMRRRNITSLSSLKSFWKKLGRCDCYTIELLNNGNAMIARIEPTGTGCLDFKTVECHRFLLHFHEMFRCSSSISLSHCSQMFTICSYVDPVAAPSFSDVQGQLWQVLVHPATAWPHQPRPCHYHHHHLVTTIVITIITTITTITLIAIIIITTIHQPVS